MVHVDDITTFKELHDERFDDLLINLDSLNEYEYVRLDMKMYTEFYYDVNLIVSK